MKIVNDSTIINCTPIIIKNGERPNRLVLRKISDEQYIVHRENMQINGDVLEHFNFYHGEHFGSLNKATDSFNKRAKQLDIFSI